MLISGLILKIHTQFQEICFWVYCLDCREEKQRKSRREDVDYYRRPQELRQRRGQIFKADQQMAFLLDTLCETSDLLPWTTAFPGWYPVVLTPSDHLLLSPSCHRLLSTHHFVIGSYSLLSGKLPVFQTCPSSPCPLFKNNSLPSHYLSSSSSAGLLHYNPFCVCILFLCYSSPFPPAPPSSCFS